MQHRMITLAALLMTAALLYFIPAEETPGEKGPGSVPVTVVWVHEREKAVDRWLRKCAAVYEKETGERIYLRAATTEETQAALEDAEQIVLPDCLVAPGGGQVLCLRGYALIVRDETVESVTPAPTSALFYQPTPAPQAEVSPAPTLGPDWMKGVLAEMELVQKFPAAQLSADPAADLAAGKGEAALLTAGQAGALTMGYRAYALPEGGGLLTVEGKALSSRGDRFLTWLQDEAAQARLADFGLYAADPAVILYGAREPLRGLIEQSRLAVP